MVEFFINNSKLFLNEKSKVRLIFSNPFLATDFNNKSFSFPIDVPLTEQNIKALEFSHRIDSSQRFFKTNVIAKYKSNQFLEGKLKLISFSDKNYRANIDITSLLSAIPDKSIREIDLGGNITLGATTEDVLVTANAKIAQSYPATTFNFPSIANPDFYGDANPDFCGVLNKYDTTAESFIKNDVSNPNIYNLVPQVYLLHIFKQIFAEIGYSVIGDFINDENIKLLMIYCNVALDTPTESILEAGNDTRASLTADFESVLGDDSVVTGLGNTQLAEALTSLVTQIADNIFVVPFNDDSTEPNFDTDNRFNTTTHTYEAISADDYTLTYNLDLLPNYGIELRPAEDFYLVVRTYFDGVVIDEEIVFVTADDSIDYTNITKTVSYTVAPGDENKFFEVKVFSLSIYLYDQMDILYSWGCTRTKVKAGSYIICDKGTDTTVVFCDYKKQINLQSIVPDIKCNDFITECRRQFKLNFSFDVESKTVNVSFLKNYISIKKIVNLTDTKQIGYEGLVKQEKTFGYKYEKPTSDLYATTNWDSIPTVVANGYDEATDKIALKLVPLLEVFSTGLVVNAAGNALMCKIQQRGNSDMFSLGTENDTNNLRLFYYQGIDFTTDTKEYPFCTSFGVNANAATVITETLSLSGETGIIEFYHALFNLFELTAEEFVIGNYLNFNDIKNLDFGAIHQIDHAHYFLKQVDVSLGKNIEVAKLSLLKID